MSPVCQTDRSECVCACACVRACTRARVSACAREGPLPRLEPSLPGPTLPTLGLPKCLGACLCPRQAARPACVGCSGGRRGRMEHWRSARKPGASLGILPSVRAVLGLRRATESVLCAPFLPFLTCWCLFFYVCSRFAAGLPSAHVGEPVFRVPPGLRGERSTPVASASVRGAAQRAGGGGLAPKMSRPCSSPTSRSPAPNNSATCPGQCGVGRPPC